VINPRFLRIDENSPYRQLIGVGGVGSGIFFALEGDSTLGRNESRLGRLLDVRDYCKLHIVIHYVAKLLGTRLSEGAFQVMPVAKVGGDATGRRVIQEMREVGIDTGHIQTVPGAPTLFSVCFQYPDGAGGNITTSNSAAGLLSESDVDEVADVLRSRGRQIIALAVPEVPLEIRRYFLEQATNSGALRVASLAAAEVKAAMEAGIFDLLDLVALNENEGEELVGSPLSAGTTEEFVRKCQDLLRDSYPDLKVIVSAGKAGAYGITAQECQHCPAVEVKVASTAGAGDALLGGVIAALAAGIPFLNPASATHQHAGGCIDSALDLGVLLGSFTCLSPHTIHPQTSLDTLIEFAENHGLAFSPEIERLFARDTVTQPAE
jgi:sugar/nucleoside kinase (ribokinase family)